MSNQPVAIITGGGSGIGLATARQLTAWNHRLVLSGRREEPLRVAAAEFGESQTECVAGDVSQPADAARLVQAAISRFGRVDVLVNNAGHAPLANIDRTTHELLTDVFGVNTFAPAYLIAACWPHMTAQRAGCIINLSTLGTHDPFPGFFAYAAAKASVNLMARSCAKEGARQGIRAFSIAPGAVETAMLRANFPESRVPANACLKPEAVAALIVACITGQYDARNGDTIFISAQTGIK